MQPLDPIEEAIFSAASALNSTTQRTAFLDQACGGNHALRKRLDALLEAGEHAESYFAADPLAIGAETLQATARPATPLTEAAGTRVGRYKLLQQIGEGGMGVVYMAEQEEPVRRRVALKIIKLGMDTRQVVARFEAERQALALMDHPNIARVLDGGATDTGRPYFVMELVQGVPITEFCDRNRLDARRRLQLFITVCQAIQSAHQKGIIHRDIKPSNVLVTLHDGVPVPKVIDFGIAKATNQKLTEKTLFTNFASMIGTPAYMSPEQAEMTGLDTDTRTDIYALGVLLYELLTGTTPFPEKRLRSLAYGEMQRVIQEEEPERPSNRLSTMANEQRTVIARNSGEDLLKLSELLKGDLDWIVMKCLEKDRQRRYETANGLAADIQRHLGNEPVMARPPSAGYRFWKMVRRNRTATIATAIVAMALILASGFSTLAFLRERQARLDAAAADLAKENARRATLIETVRADSVSRFVTGFFDATIPGLERRGHVDAIRHLLSVAEELASTLTNAPAAEGEIRFGIGEALAGVLNQFPAAEIQFGLAEARAASLGRAGEHLGRLAASSRRGCAMWQDQDNDAAKAVLEIGRQALRENPPDTDASARAISNVALFQSYRGQAADAESLASEVLASSPDDAGHLRARMQAFEILARCSFDRGARDVSARYQERLFTLGSTHHSPSGLATLMKVMSEGDPSWLMEDVVQQALRNAPATATELRALLRGYGGFAAALSGDWGRGLEALSEVVTNSICPIDLWHSAMVLTGLAGQPEKHRWLSSLGMVRFGSGADSEVCRHLADALLVLPPEPSALPVIQGLAERSLAGPPWTRVWGQYSVALQAYREGRLQLAKQKVEAYLEGGSTRLPQGLNPFWARGWFLLSAIQARLEFPDKARQSYDRGMQLHSPHLAKPGEPFSGSHWFTACEAELLRREVEPLVEIKR